MLEGGDGMLLQPRRVSVKGKGVMDTYVYRPPSGAAATSQPCQSHVVQAQGRWEDAAAAESARDPTQNPDPFTPADGDASDPDPDPDPKPDPGPFNDDLSVAVISLPPSSAAGGVQSSYSGKGGRSKELQFLISMDGRPCGSSSGGPGG